MTTLKKLVRSGASRREALIELQNTVVAMGAAPAGTYTDLYTREEGCSLMIYRGNILVVKDLLLGGQDLDAVWNVSGTGTVGSDSITVNYTNTSIMLTPKGDWYDPEHQYIVKLPPLIGNINMDVDWSPYYGQLITGYEYLGVLIDPGFSRLTLYGASYTDLASCKFPEVYKVL